MNPVPASLSADEDHGRTSEEEEGGVEHGYDRQVDIKGIDKFFNKPTWFDINLGLFIHTIHTTSYNSVQYIDNMLYILIQLEVHI